MAGGLDVVVRFIGDSSKLQGEVAKVEGTGDKVKSWAKGIGVAIGAAFAVDQVKQWVGAASELQDQLSASQQIFGSAAKGVEDFAGKADNAFGISKSGALAAANTFATFGKSAGLSGDQLGGFATGLTGLAGDLASFRGTSPEQAIEAIGAALRGESEPIRQYGVLLDDATLKNRAMALGLISSTKEALTPQQKVLAAQAEILAQTGDAQGDFARTGDSAANQQKKLQANIENTQAALGSALLPVLSALLPILQTFAKFIEENAGWLVPLTAAVLGVTAAVWLFNAALAANPIVLITIALAALVAAIILAYQNVEVFRTIVDAVMRAAVAAFTWLLDTVKLVFAWVADHWPLLLAIITGPFGLAVGLIINNFDTIKRIISGAIDWLRGVFSTVADIVASPFRWAAQQIGSIVEGIKSTFSGAIDTVKTLWNTFARGWNAIEIEVPSVHIPWPIDKDVGGFTLGVPDLPTFATGGIVTRATLAMLGERGPEAVVPLDRWNTGQVYLTVNVTTSGLGADVPAIQSAVVAAMRGYVTRNGPITGIAG